MNNDNNEIHVLPPVRGACPVCGAWHGRDAPHDVNSLYYRTKFRQKHGRYPTPEDAERHLKQNERSGKKQEEGGL